MKIYISIPMTNQDWEKQERKAKKWQRHFESQGFKVENPFGLGDWLYKQFQKYERIPDYQDYLEFDLIMLAKCSHVFFCNGWEKSNGCKEEHKLAGKLPLIKIIYEKEYKKEAATL